MHVCSRLHVAVEHYLAFPVEMRILEELGMALVEPRGSVYHRPRVGQVLVERLVPYGVDQLFRAAVRMI